MSILAFATALGSRGYQVGLEFRDVGFCATLVFVGWRSTEHSDSRPA